MLASCGARTGLELPEDGGSDVTHDVGREEGSEVEGPCTLWGAAHDPIQVSEPVGNMQLLDALPISSCVLVGYSNSDHPIVDPRWVVRRVCLPDGSLGAANGVFRREASQFGWTAISLAEGFGRIAAAAWDRAGGMRFVSLDETGAAVGTPVQRDSLPVRELHATPNGYTVLQNPIDGVRAPVVLTTLDSSGQVTGSSRQLIDDSARVNVVSRIRLADRSFLLIWTAEDSCPECRTLYVHHLSETGDALAPRSLVHAFGADDLRGHCIAATAVGYTAAWFERSDDGRIISITAYDFGGESLGPPSVLTSIAGTHSEALTIGSAPSGDLIAAWTVHPEPLESQAQLFVQALTPTGSTRGSEVLLGSYRSYNNGPIQVVSALDRAVVLYESMVPGVGVQVFAIPLRCER
jgi:hypothetical protein